MSGKPRKKAAKKVKPSGPARCAVLWGLDPSFGEAAAEKGAALRGVLREMGVRVRVVKPEQLGDAAGAVAGLVGFRPSPMPYVGPVPECEFVLLAGFDGLAVSEFIARCREADCVVGPKALLTPANKTWPLARLIEAVCAEHVAMTSGQ